MLLKAKEFNGFYFNRYDLKTSRIIEHSGIKFLNPHEVKDSKININHKSNFKSINSKSMRKSLDIDYEQNRLEISSLFIKRSSCGVCESSQYVRENVIKEESKFSVDMFDDSFANIKKISIGVEGIK
jgi:formate dehydrogenase assembly factor FdhD